MWLLSLVTAFCPSWSPYYSRYTASQSISVLLSILQYTTVHLTIVYPSYTQGLSDPEETVVCKTIEAMTTLTEQGLFDHRTLVEAVSSVAPFLIHPVRLTLVSSPFLLWDIYYFQYSLHTILRAICPMVGLGSGTTTRMAFVCGLCVYWSSYMH